MKKKLEAELISIAHRILKLKNKSELAQLHQESRKLYEQLSVLLFVEENFEGLQPTIGRSEAYQVLETAFGKKDGAGEIVPDAQEKAIEEAKADGEEQKEASGAEIVPAEMEAQAGDTVPEPAEEEKIIVGEINIPEEEDEVPLEAELPADAEEMPEKEKIGAGEETEIEEEPSFELAFDEKESVAEVAKESGRQIIFEDFLGSDYKDLEFVKADLAETKHDTEPEVLEAEEIKAEKAVPQVQEEIKHEVPAQNHNEQKVAKGITIGLNDRVGFVNHLFAGSSEDFNRVLSQLNTFGNFKDAKNFIEDLVKPDYNSWKGKEDYEERFLEVVENKFR